MSPLQIPGGIELVVFLLVVLFNLAVVALLVTGAVFLFRRVRGDGTADEADLDALRDRITDLERQVEELAERGDEAAVDGTAGGETVDDDR